MKKYTHLTQDERNQIVVLVNRRKSLRYIAEYLNRHVSAISREIKRNHGRKLYRAHRAEEKAIYRHHNAHRKMRLKSRVLRTEVEKLIMEGWSPEIIAGRFKQRPDLPPISHEAIYQWIYSAEVFHSGVALTS